MVEILASHTVAGSSLTASFLEIVFNLIKDPPKVRLSVQLAVRIGPACAPATAFPLGIIQIRIAAHVHAGTQIDEPGGPLYPRGQNVARRH
jgi:hypothetical protein